LNKTPTLSIAALRRQYREGTLTPQTLLPELLARARADAARNVWITLFDEDRVLGYVDALKSRAPDTHPLYGIPFAIKDNLDLEGVPTTAACPAFAYTPTRSATTVQRLLDAGAVPIGKTNLDQFATGLVGTRSPYGACGNAVDAAFVSGGSSSGSAVAVARSLVSFALGTDTAGSGRVPAAFNNVIGLKPSIGRLSNTGAVPACRSLDCISIFAQCAADAGAVLDASAGFDAGDPYSRTLAARPIAGTRCGVPRAAQLKFFGDRAYQALYAQSLEHMQQLGFDLVELDFEPFFEAGRLLYEGPWLAERYAAVGEFIDAHAQAVHPVTRAIIVAGGVPSAATAFKAQYRLMSLRQQAAACFAAVDVLLTPTAGTVYRIADVEAEPLRLNGNLGYYTTFMNLLDLTGVAVPAGFRDDGMPFGVSLTAPCGSERALLRLADRLQRSAVQVTGALGVPLPPAEAPDATPGLCPPGYLAVAVCGAHMSGLALNHQLTARGGALLERTATAAKYRLYALPGGPPARPGLIKVDADGAAIEVEVWALPQEQVGAFLAGIPAPLGLGRVELLDGRLTTGFICEGLAAAGARDITHFKGWRAFLAAG
jgi:allophanate hydrolase